MCTDADSGVDDDEVAAATEYHVHPPDIRILRVLPHQRFAEYYSPPRIATPVRDAGFEASLSCDITTGWNFELAEVRALSFHILDLLAIEMVGLSPPCTIFSDIQRLWNIKRMTKERYEAKWAHGMLLLRHAMDVCMLQYRSGRCFFFEHPARATSWGTEVVRRIQELPGVHCVNFDMCRLGLVSKASRTPMRKRTTIMTNCHALSMSLQGKLCTRDHEHVPIHGNEGGMSRAAFAQIYPPGLVSLISHDIVSL